MKRIDGRDSHDGFSGEEVTSLLDGRPDGRQRQQPVDEETQEGLGCRARVGDPVGDSLVRGEDGGKKDGHALTPDPGLNTEPDHRHDRPVEYQPVGSPDTE